MSSVTDVLNKLKQLPQARLSQLVVVLLLIYIASIMANITWMLIPGGDSGTKIMAPGQAVNANAAKSTGQSFNISSLTSLNIFGQHTVEDKIIVAPVVKSQEEIPETNLDLTLSATVAEGTNGKGTAIIASSGSQGTYGIDDKIDSSTAVVKQVFTDRVIIQNGPNRETLMLDGVEYDNHNVATKIKNPDARQSPRKNSFTSPRKVDNRGDLSLTQRLSSAKAELAKNPAKLHDLIKFSPVRKGGGLVGYRLNPGAQPDLFKQAGFRPNDLAVEVNGYQLTDMKQAMEAMREFRNLTEANIVVERDGIRTPILFSFDGPRGEERRSQPAPKAPARKKPKGQLN